MDHLKYCKAPRLKEFSYTGFYRYFVTICTKDKTIVFDQKESVDNAFGILKDRAEKYKFNIIAYCFMPDHLHLLLQGKNENSNLVEFIKEFKQISGYRFKKKTQRKLWQESFYEHVLRDKDNPEDIIEYIMMNPVRKGLVENYADYPYSGSITIT